MKKLNLKSMLAWLLTLCLLLGGFAALAEDVTVTIDATDPENAVITVSGGDVDRVHVSANKYDDAGIRVGEDHAGYEDAAEKGATFIGSYVANADSVSRTEEGEFSAVGVTTRGGRAGDVTVNVNGDVTATGTEEIDEDDENFAYSDVTGINVYSGTWNTATISAGNINAKASGKADEMYVQGVGVSMGTSSGGKTYINAGDVIAEASNTGELTDSTGAYVCTYSSKDTTVEIDIGNVKATTNAEGYEASADAVSISSYDSEGQTITVNVSGDAIAEASSDNTAQARGLSIRQTDDNSNAVVTVNVDGNVKATAKGADGSSYASGINAGTNNNNTLNVAIAGDVTAVGEDGVGLSVYNDQEGKTNILVGGTLSGQTVAVRTDSDTDVESINLYAWKVAENADGAIADVLDEEGNRDATASTNLEKAIRYIAKVADATLTVTGTSTYAANDTTYQLAHQNENVLLSFTLNEAEEGLDGILYNAEDKTAAKADEWGKNSDGSYWVKMLRGGGMLLGLNTHKHEKATREENKVAATCTKDGSYDLVTYCTKCNKVLSTEKKTIAATGHTAGAAVKENEVAATCAKAGSYDEVVYCTVCKTELSRTNKAVDKLAHTAGAAVKENEVAATCAKAGSYDEVVVCTVCKQELSRTKKAVDPLAHTPAEAVRENITAAKPSVPGGYDDVVYCSVCKAELSRAHVDLPALPDEEKPAAPQVALVYEPVDENTEVNGVKVADHPEAAEALATVGEALDGENVTVSIPGAEKLMDEAEKERFDKLPVKDRLLVVLSALGFANEGLGDVGENMSEDAKALSADIAERMEALPEAEKQALLDSIAAQFPKGTVTVDGKACESFSIDLVIDRDGAKTYERYTFYNDNGAWKLYGIEKGAYKEV